MTSGPPRDEPQVPFDPLAPMASDFEYESGAAFSTPDPFKKTSSPETPRAANLDFANPTGGGPIDYESTSYGGAARSESVNPYDGGTASSNPYAVGPGGPQAPPYSAQQPGAGAPYGAYGPPPAPYGAYGGFPYGQVQRLNTPALIGMIVSLVSLVICFGGILTGVIGVVLGAVGMAQIRRDPAQYRGTGMAVTAIVIGGIVALFWTVTFIAGANTPSYS